MEPTWMSVLPAAVAIVFALATRQVLVALLAGILSGSIVWLLQTEWPENGGAAATWAHLAAANPLERFFLPAVGTNGFAVILLIYLWALGGLIGVWGKTGGARHFAKTVGHRIARGPRSSLLFGWMVGVVFHQGGTVSTVLAGTTVKPVTDRHRVSHEELAYVVDSTASPVATIVPFNAWPAYVGALAAGTVPFLPAVPAGMDNSGELTAARSFFIESLLFNFYGMFAVLGTLLFAIGWIPCHFPKMRQAIERARSTGELDAPGAEPMLRVEVDDEVAADGYRPSLWDFLVPMVVLLSLAIVPYVLEQVGVLEDGMWINEAFCLCVVSAIVTAKLRGMRIMTALDGFIDGCQRMTIGAMVLALAVTLGTVSKELGTATWITGAIGDGIAPVWLPAILIFTAMGISFATGSSWGTYAVVVPVALPIAYALSPDMTFVSICFGGVIGGSVFGDQCSPISDTTILSSMFTGCDLMDHVRTQLPLAFTAASAGAVLSTVCAAAL